MGSAGDPPAVSGVSPETPFQPTVGETPTVAPETGALPILKPPPDAPRPRATARGGQPTPPTQSSSPNATRDSGRRHQSPEERQGFRGRLARLERASRREALMVAVGLNPRFAEPKDGNVAEARASVSALERRSATRSLPAMHRGLKPTATVGSSLRDDSPEVGAEPSGRR
jgi:hypothetical protein